MQDRPPGVEEVTGWGLEVRGLHWHADTAKEPLPLHRLQGRARTRNVLSHHTSMTNLEKKKKRGVQRERIPERKWAARLATSEPWECPVGAREVSSSAGCWCSPAVVQPCSLFHPRPASYTDREGEDVVIGMILIESWKSSSNSH